MIYVIENYLIFGLSFVGLLVVVSVTVRKLTERYIRKFDDQLNSSSITAREFLNNVLESEDFVISIKEGEDVVESEFLWKDGVVKVPKLDEGSLLTLALSAHELGHADQVRNKRTVAAMVDFLERTGRYLSYSFPLIMISGLVFYPPLLLVSLIAYLLIILILLAKIPFEAEASSKGLLYLENYTELTGKELAQLKKLLWLAILTRLTDLTVGFLAVFDLTDQR